jgi:hypothetical protein
MDILTTMRNGLRTTFDIHHHNALAKSYITRYASHAAHVKAVQKKKQEHYRDLFQKPQVLVFTLTGGISNEHCKTLMNFARRAQHAFIGNSEGFDKRLKLDWETAEGNNQCITELAVGALRATENSVVAARNRAADRARGGDGRAASGTIGRFDRGSGWQERERTKGCGKSGRPTGWQGGRARGCALDRNGDGKGRNETRQRRAQRENEERLDHGTQRGGNREEGRRGREEEEGETGDRKRRKGREEQAKNDRTSRRATYRADRKEGGKDRRRKTEQMARKQRGCRSDRSVPYPSLRVAGPVKAGSAH